MKSALRLAFVVSMTLFGTGVYADDPLTLAQLHAAANWSTSDFSEANPDVEIYGFTVARGEEEGANVRVYYESGESYVGYFCHVHSHNEIDCHELD